MACARTRAKKAPAPANAEALEGQAWLASGFSDHYLTDAFAAGHLISGLDGRTRRTPTPSPRPVGELDGASVDGADLRGTNLSAAELSQINVSFVLR